MINKLAALIKQIPIIIKFIFKLQVPNVQIHKFTVKITLT